MPPQCLSIIAAKKSNSELFREMVEGYKAKLDKGEPFNWKPAIPTLQAWADHLRSALKELTK